ncbi:MAG: leucine-rich repeat protein [Clostridia bacterium]|nr:leucine-rich repeat protein [Clostridia bacterium]
MNNENKPKTPKEIDVFNRFSHFNKLKILAIALSITIVLSVTLYFFSKSLFTYTVDYVTNGGMVFGEELKSDKYKFLQKTKEPKNLKKEGYYIEGYYKDKNFSDEYKFGKSVWNSFTLHVKWKEGYAVQLFFAEGEEEKTSMTEEYLKLYFEQYVEPNTKYTLPDVFNNIEGDKHYGEQLLWYDNPECTGHPVENETYLVDKNIPLYGKWFETDASKFQIDSDGVLIRYLGVCDKLILPSGVLKIKDIDSSKFTPTEWNTVNTADGSVFSAFDKVLGELQIVYVNPECVELGSCAFRGAKNLRNVYFEGDSLVTIDDWAFGDCANLKSIDVPVSVKTIGNRAFSNCGTGEDEFGQSFNFEYTGGWSVESVGNYAFANSTIKEISFDSLKFMGSMALAGCRKLESLTLYYDKSVVETNVPADNLFYNVLNSSSKCMIYVPAELVNVYKNTSPWLAYADRIFEIA